VTPKAVDQQLVQDPEATSAQYLACVLGVAYLVTGLLGFAVTGSMGFTAHDPQVQMAGLTVNPLHNLVHAVVGALGVFAVTRSRRAQRYGVLVLVVFGALAVTGFLGLGTGGMNTNTPDNWLHAATAVLGLLMAIVPTRAQRGSSAQVTGSSGR
jgi:peptidoglycan/LPS O-acetylase OafA/YrhL